ncbi:MAG: hypothetical protein PHY64_02190 [Eubacteriales bacterium]|nr:hypothetical protein [Eubacteriales bacterium]
MSGLAYKKQISALVVLVIAIIFLPWLATPAKAGVVGTFDWETADYDTLYSSASQTVSVIGKGDVTATVTSTNSNLSDTGIYIYNVSTDGSIDSISSGKLIVSGSNSDDIMTFTFSQPVNIISAYAVESYGLASGTWTYTPTGGTNSTVTDSIGADDGHTVALNWTAVSSFTVTSNTSDTAFGFDDIILGSNDATPPTITGAVRNSDTQIMVSLSEVCQNLSKFNDGGFTVHKTGDASTAYTVTATAQSGDASYVALTVANLGTAAGTGVTVTYTAGINGTIADLADNPLATDLTGVTVDAWDTTAPTVLSINRYNPSAATTNAASVVYRVTFDEGVTGVDASDFSLTSPSGGVTGTIASVAQSTSSVYDVTVNSISGNGTLRLDLKNSGTGIKDIGGTAISTGFTSGQTYTFDQIAPTLSSAVRSSDTQITVALSEACQNLIKSNDGGFTVHKTGDASTAYAVSATAQGTDTSHVVLTVANLGTAAGAGVTVTYTAGPNGTIADSAGNPLATDATGVTVDAWDTTAPTVTNILRNNPVTETTNATSVIYLVTFSEGVTGVDVSDFSLTSPSGGVTGTVASVASGSASSYNVTVNSISGSGTLRLDLKNSGTGIKDIGGTAISTGFTSGQTYTFDLTAPTLSSAVRSSDTQITVALSEACQNLIKSNDGGFIVKKTDDASTPYAVSATAQGTDTSHVVLTVADIGTAAGAGVTVTYMAGLNGTVTDTAGNPLATDLTGVTVDAWDIAAPTVLSINRYNPATETTNAASVVYRVTFSEGVTGVDASDFSPFSPAGGVTGTVASVAQSTSSVYDVTVNSISGSGTLRLDLKNADTGIKDIGGTAISTGFSSGQTYTFDHTAPTVLSINRYNPSTETTALLSVVYRVTFSEAVTGVDTSDFSLFSPVGGVSGNILSVTASSTSVYDVTVSAISGNGTLRLDLKSSGTGIKDTAGTDIASGYTSGQLYTIDHTPPTLSSAVRSSDTQITVALSEGCLNLAKSNNGGFTVSKVGNAATTYAVSATAQGADASHVVLTVDSIALAGYAGVKITYATGANGTITDTAGNVLATDTTGVTISAWDTSVPSMTGAVRDSNTQITIALSEACRELAKSNDGGFTVSKVGDASTTYAVSATAQGADTSHVVLTVDSIALAGYAGVKITYVTGANGTITDLSGNALATDATGVTIAAWDTSAPMIIGVVRDSDTRITVTLNEECLNVAKPNDGGFTVTQTGTGNTFQVYSTAQGSVILTVANMAAAEYTGVTVTYTAGGNGTITDLSGNALASTGNGYSIAPWNPAIPVTGDSAAPELWLILLLGSCGLLAGYGIYRLIRKRKPV